MLRSSSEIFLIMGKDAPQYEAREHIPGGGTQQTYINHDHKTLAECFKCARQHAASGIVQCPHYSGHIAASCSDLCSNGRYLVPRITEQLTNCQIAGLQSLCLYQVNERSPAS